jgi:hypothetical protein
MKIILLFKINNRIKNINSTVVNYQMLPKTQIVWSNEMFIRMKKMKIGILVWILISLIFRDRATLVFKRKKISSLKGLRN